MKWFENFKSVIDSLFNGNNNTTQNVDSTDITASDDLIDSSWGGGTTKF